MSRVVIRALLSVTVVAALMGMTSGTSAAGSSLGQVCVNLAPFTDTIRMDLETTNGPVFLLQVTFRWRKAESFQIVGTGAITDAFPATGTPGTLALGLSGTHNTAFFLGNRVCTLNAEMSPPSFSGPFRITCTGTPTASVVTGTMNFIDCATEVH